MFIKIEKIIYHSLKKSGIKNKIDETSVAFRIAQSRHGDKEATMIGTGSECLNAIRELLNSKPKQLEAKDAITIG